MNLEETALSLASKGFWVFPIAVARDREERKHLSFPGGRWVDVAAQDAATVRDMFWGDATHVGIHCERSGIVVVDLDACYHEEENYEYEGEELLDLYYSSVAPDGPDGAPATYSQSGRGMHIYYRMDPDHPVASSVGRVAPWVDVRALGGLLIYGGGGLEDLASVQDLPLAPEWLAEASAPTEQATAKAPPRPPRYRPTEDGTPYGLEALKLELRRLTEAWERDDGTFNHTLNSVAFAVGQLVAGGELDEAAAYARIDAALTEMGAPPGQWKTLDSGFWSGYEHPRSATDLNEGERVSDEQITALRSQLLSVDQLGELPAPAWLIPEWVETNSFVHLIGAAGSMKTFVTLDLAACVASGRSWPDHADARHQPLPVLYVIGETAHGVGQRGLAWKQHYGEAPLLRFLPVPVPILKREKYNPRALTESSDWTVFREMAKEIKPAMIIFDTQARMTVGINENDAAEMSVVVEVLERLQRETSAAVVMVHHTGKGENATARGSSVLIGAVSTEITVKKAGPRGEERVTISNTKQKNAPAAASIRMNTQPVGPSIVLVRDQGPPPAEQGYERSRAKQSVRSALRENGGPMSVTEVTEASGLSDRSNVRRILLWMVERGDVTKTEGQRHGQAADLYMWVGPGSTHPDPE